MKFYHNETVLEAAKKRMHFLYDRYDHVVVGFSGGKDSVVLTELAIEVARERDQLPVPVLFVDQEAEWQATIDMVEDMMTREEVKPYWLQVPIKLFNATSVDDQWLYCWNPEKQDKWIHPKHELSIKENKFGTDRFKAMFTHFLKWLHPDEPAIYLSGVRAEESPGRFLGMTGQEVEYGRTWGKILSRDRRHFTYYPLYDWSYTDIWKAIHEHGWSYNKVYDYMYQYGIEIQNMRVSNIHHNTAVNTLFFMQEVEPETYDRAAKRLDGISTASNIGKNDYWVYELPYMFESWKEYRDFLLPRITNEEQHEKFKNKFDTMDEKYCSPEGKYGEMNERGKRQLFKKHVQTLIANDYHFVKVNNWERKPEVHWWRKCYNDESYYENPFIDPDDFYEHTGIDIRAKSG